MSELAEDGAPARIVLNDLTKIYGTGASENGRVIAVAQPHRYTRLADLMDDFQNCFNDADKVFVTPVYEAGEAPLPGVNSAALVAGVKSRGHRSAQTIADQSAPASALWLFGRFWPCPLASV